MRVLGGNFMATLVKKEGNQVTFTFEIASETFEGGVQKAYLKNRKHFDISGFRKGKVPRKLIEQRYGVEVFYDDAINEVLPEAYEAAVKELALDPVDRPSVDFKEEIVKGQPVVMEAEVTVKPEVKLGEYKGLEVEKTEPEITDEAVDHDLSHKREEYARVTTVEDRAAKEGDTLTIDYKGFVGEEQFEGGTAEGQTLELGSNAFIPGFEEQLVGKNVGDDVEVKVTFPEEYHAENLAGQEAKFEVTIHEIKEKELPELDDEFAKDVSEFDTLEELKADIKANLLKQAQESAENEFKNTLIDKIVENTEIDLPEAMVDGQINAELQNFQYSLMYQGLTLDKYFELTNTTAEDLKAQMRPNAEKMVRGELVLEAIGKAESIEVSDDELEEEYTKMAERYNRSVEDLKKDLKDGDVEYIRAGAVKRKTIDFIAANVK
jgi:trigger factor